MSHDRGVTYDVSGAASHRDAVVELLGATLGELGVAQPLIAQVAAIAESTRADVLGR